MKTRRSTEAGIQPPKPGIKAAKPAKVVATRRRIDRAADRLFSRHGIRAVGVDALVAKSGVAKMTLYRHYSSKEKLAAAFLERRGLWMREWLQGEIQRRAEKPAAQLLAVFDALDEWFRQRDFEGCSLIRLVVELDQRNGPARRAVVRSLASIRALLRDLAEQAGVRNADEFARQWHMLTKGAIVSVCEGDIDAARRAKELGELLLARHAVNER